jgi:F-type H+-transporting ATPase subunit delta
MFATPQGANLLGLLSENNRLVVLSEISKQFDQLKMQAEQKVNVTITSATALDNSQAAALIESLQRRLGRKVELEQRVDEALVGGAVIQADDMVIDGSVRSRLQRLTESLLD